jgi:hypothetical protein
MMQATTDDIKFATFILLISMGGMTMLNVFNQEQAKKEIIKKIEKLEARDGSAK